MLIAERLMWGSLAGGAIVLVKIVGPDRDYVYSLFASAATPDIAFYIFISVVTMLLGLVSGAFSNEPDRVKLLLFCASVPGLLSTATGQLREPALGLPPAASEHAEADYQGAEGERVWLSSVIVSSARAQTGDESHVCSEGSFIQQFSLSAKNYFSGERPQYSVIVWSTRSFDEAKGLADELSEEPGDWQATVGCRRPNNDYYPVMIGTGMTQIEAATLLGQFVEAAPRSEKPYLDNYPYRDSIYMPPGTEDARSP